MFAQKSISRILFVLFVIVFMLAVMPLQSTHAAGVRYAKPAASGSGDCLSWANACALQIALTGAVSSDEIWAAAGTYKPTIGADRAATFQLKDGVALYGGFGGTETARDQRNPTINVTVLSGDIDNNDSQTPIITDLTSVTGNTTNSYHVVTGETGATGATLDGFAITAGYANGTSSNDSGAGMSNSGSPTLTNVTFSGNSAYFVTGNGGGMSNSGSPILTNVTFNSNSAYAGGGMSNSGSPTLMNVTFNGNSVWDSGGRGGGMSNVQGSPTLTNVTFSGNSAYFGGGMYNFGGNNSHPTLTNVTFSGNSAYIGGGMENENYAIPTLTNVTFKGNSVWSGGSGGAIYNLLGSNPQIRNTIFWSNWSNIVNDGSSSVVSDSVVQGDCGTGSICTNIIKTDPKLGTLGDYGGSTQTIPLLPGSSAIDKGNDAICPATDQRGVARPQGAQCDIGAFEAFEAFLLRVFLPAITKQ